MVIITCVTVVSIYWTLGLGLFKYLEENNY